MIKLDIQKKIIYLEGTVSFNVLIKVFQEKNLSIDGWVIKIYVANPID